jgi:hypothetical protein
VLDIDSDPYSMFIFAMNAPQTREKYVTRLNRFFNAIVCTMTSSGIRLGAWDYLKWEHIQPIRKFTDGGRGYVLAAKIIVYSGEEGDEYFSFITPEAYYELEKWMEYRRSSGENISGKSWLLRNVWNTKKGFKKGLVTKPEKLKPSGVKRLMEDALWTQRLRKKLDPGRRRHDFQTDHGFRKWFKTRCLYNNTTKMEKDEKKSLVDQQFSDVSSDRYITRNLLHKVAIMAPYFKQQLSFTKTEEEIRRLIQEEVKKK